jgi:EAL domain-containing protein (putative c-di-GMP-specific phosphodiesterase class I)
MAQSMGMNTVAEGVERTEQLHFLRENGCDACQGYLGGNAMPAEAALAFVRTAGGFTPAP